MKDFQTKLSALASKGLNKDLYNQIVSMGVDTGAAYVNALSKGTPQDIAAINKLNAQIGTQAQTMGNAAADAMYAAGQSSAAGYYAGLLANQKQLTDAANTLANKLIAQIKKKLGIHSPSRVALELGRNFGAAFADGIISQMGTVTKNATALANASTNIQPPPSPATTPATGYSTPVVPGGGVSTVFQQQIDVHTQEIDPRKHAADLGFELFQRVI
jgi:hypothetical protein